MADYRHKNVKRLNIPPAGLEARGEIAREKRIKWAYNPHLPPMLRFDATGQADEVAELIEAAGKRPLTAEETKHLQEAFRNHEPWLEWAGKREQHWCVADPLALHIHERLSTQAILKVAKREDNQRDLFADPEHEYRLRWASTTALPSRLLIRGEMRYCGCTAWGCMIPNYKDQPHSVGELTVINELKVPAYA